MADEIHQSAERLRQAFDASFSMPAVVQTKERQQPILDVLAGTRQVSLRLAEVAGVMRAPNLTPVPSQQGSLRGIFGVRGKLAGAYSLAQLLGQDRSGGAPRWLVLCREDESVALLVEELLGTRQLVLEGSSSVPNQEQRRASLVEVVSLPGGLVPLVNLAQVTREVLGG